MRIKIIHVCSVIVALVLLSAVGYIAFVDYDRASTINVSSTEEEGVIEFDNKSDTKKGDVLESGSRTPRNSGSLGVGNGDFKFKYTAREDGLIYNESGFAGYEGEANSGVYVSDYNNDNFPDILAMGGRHPVLFRNQHGKFVRSNALPEFDKSFFYAHFFDYNNDGWDDLYLLSNNGSVLLENTRGEFNREQTSLNTEYDSVRGVATADYTGNGCLDVFVVQAQDWQESRPKGFNKTISLSEDNGEPNRLFSGNCNGEFVETTHKSGIHGGSWSLATSFVDFTNDSLPDIHVANDFNNDVLYINEGDGTFDKHVLPNSTDRNAMSSEVAYINGTEYPDVFVSNIYSKRDSSWKTKRYDGNVTGNNLLVNSGDGDFVDKAKEYGVKRSGYGWAATFADLNNDRHYELYQSTTGSPKQNVYNTSHLWTYTNNSFNKLDTSAVGMIDTYGMGNIAIDYDMDGDLDLIESNYDINKRMDEKSNFEGNFRLYENVGESGNFIRVKIGATHALTNIGTEVSIQTDGATQTKILNSRSDYQSQGWRTLHFGLGDSEFVDLRVTFADGSQENYKNITANQRVILSKSDIKTETIENK